jgi:hypothetical protein
MVNDPRHLRLLDYNELRRPESKEAGSSAGRRDLRFPYDSGDGWVRAGKMEGGGEPYGESGDTSEIAQTRMNTGVPVV